MDPCYFNNNNNNNYINNEVKLYNNYIDVSAYNNYTTNNDVNK